jgi:hypothetical protein
LERRRSPQLQGFRRLDIIVVIEKEGGRRFTGDFAIDHGKFPLRNRENAGAYAIFTHDLRQELDHLRHAHPLGADAGLAAKPHEVCNSFLPVVIYVIVNIIHKASRYITEI